MSVLYKKSYLLYLLVKLNFRMSYSNPPTLHCH